MLLRRINTLYKQRNLIQRPQQHYFNKYISEYKCRKDILIENRQQNDKIVRIRMPFYEKRYDQVKKNKKKFLFFVAILLITQYNDGYNRFMLWNKFREPIRNKLKRWFFSEKNLIPDTVSEQALHKFPLKKQTLDMISSEYLAKDRELPMGITRKYIYGVYKELGLIRNKEDKYVYYQVSGYGKKRNQRSAGISLQQYIHLFNEAYKKSKENDVSNGSFFDKIINKFKPKKNVPEEEFRDKFLEALNNQFEKTSKWQADFTQKISGYRKMMPHLQNHKKEIIEKYLIENPLCSLDSLNSVLKEKGLLGLSVRENVIVLQRQKALLMMYKIHYTNKSENSQLQPEKMVKFEREINDLSGKIEGLEQEIQKNYQEFENLFPGQKLFSQYED